MDPMDEKHFTLRRYDALAPAAIVAWIDQALKGNIVAVTVGKEPFIPPAKIARAARQLANILDYQDEYGAKLPD